MRSLLAVLAVCSLFAESVTAQFSMPPRVLTEGMGVTIQTPPTRLLEKAGLSAAATLSPAVEGAKDELAAMQRWNEEGRTPPRNGFSRPLPSSIELRPDARLEVLSKAPSSGILSSVRGGRLILSTRIAVAQAYRLRLHLHNVELSPDSTFWVWGRQGDEISFGMDTIVGGEGWTPSVEGEVIYLEIATAANSNGVTIDKVMEIVSPLNSGFQETVSGLECLVDATCVQSSTLDVIEVYRRAVATYSVVKGANSGICTGGLIVNGTEGRRQPYFLTANHCISSQAEAATVEAHWDFRSSSCGGIPPNLFSLPRSNGATLVASSASSDFSLIRLNSIPPNRVLLGWNADPAAVLAGTILHRISHPARPGGGAFQQTYARAVVSSIAPTCAGASRPSYLYSFQDSGAVSGGSSGAPVIIAGGQIVGQLLGTCGSTEDACDRTVRTVDGAFSSTFPQIASLLNPDMETPTTCVPSSTIACMLNGRFKVAVKYRGAFDNGPANQNAVVKTVTGFANANFETGFFYFNNSSNIEMLVKMLDQGNTDAQGRPTIAVLFGTATPLRIELEITDTNTGAVKRYVSEFNQGKGGTDFQAFVK